mmetsp:Transcript_54088/g.150414  ORF Transcript_54088/g.150414 Transcript_54088/m.150414 type:complete len:272 (+) Transcript_54088:774-1589(+)
MAWPLSMRGTWMLTTPNCPPPGKASRHRCRTRCRRYRPCQGLCLPVPPWASKVSRHSAVSMRNPWSTLVSPRHCRRTPWATTRICVPLVSRRPRRRTPRIRRWTPPRVAMPPLRRCLPPRACHTTHGHPPCRACSAPMVTVIGRHRQRRRSWRGRRRRVAQGFCQWRTMAGRQKLFRRRLRHRRHRPCLPPSISSRVAAASGPRRCHPRLHRRIARRPAQRGFRSRWATSQSPARRLSVSRTRLSTRKTPSPERPKILTMPSHIWGSRRQQ